MTISNRGANRDHIVYGDSVSGDTEIIVGGGTRVKIESLFVDVKDRKGDKEYDFPEREVLTYDPDTKKSVFRPIKYIMRHVCNKRMFRVWLNNSTYVDVTEDHSLMAYDEYGHLSNIKPEEIRGDTHIYHLEMGPSLVMTVEPIDYKGYVYDIEVEGTHTFFANNILVHNTDSVYLTLNDYVKKREFLVQKEIPFEEISKEVIALSDEMEKEVNASFPKFLMENFLVGESRTKTVEAVRDVVAPRGIFRAGKKTYALWVIDAEHKPKDEIKIVGMATKRSDTPKVIQQFIESCIERVLKERWNYPELYKYIQDYRKETYRQTEPWRRGSPQRVKNITAKAQELARYEAALEKPGTMGRHVKKPNVHFSIMAALNTNRLIDEYKELRWDKIRDGDKIEIINLKKNNEWGFKTVAIKAGEPYVPEWFKVLPFDTKAMEQKIFDKKLFNTLGEILDWDFTFVDNHAEKVFVQEDFF